MKVFILLSFLCSSAFADCDMRPLKKKIVSEYKEPIEVTNERGEIGIAKGKKFVVSNYILEEKKEIFLVANFDLDIKWPTGREQTVRTLVVGTVDPISCSIRKFQDGEDYPTMAQH